MIVHVHDIFFPVEYPKEFILKNCHFWTKQYLSRAFFLILDEVAIHKPSFGVLNPFPPNFPRCCGTLHFEAGEENVTTMFETTNHVSSIKRLFC